MIEPETFYYVLCDQPDCLSVTESYPLPGDALRSAKALGWFVEEHCHVCCECLNAAVRARATPTEPKEN